MNKEGKVLANAFISLSLIFTVLKTKTIWKPTNVLVDPLHVFVSVCDSIYLCKMVRT